MVCLIQCHACSPYTACRQAVMFKQHWPPQSLGCFPWKRGWLHRCSVEPEFNSLMLCWHCYCAHNYEVSLGSIILGFLSWDCRQNGDLKNHFYLEGILFYVLSTQQRTRLLGHSSPLLLMTSWPAAVPWAVPAVQLVSVCHLALASCHTIPSISFEALTSSPAQKLPHSGCLESFDFLSGETQCIITLLADQHLWVLVQDAKLSSKAAFTFIRVVKCSSLANISFSAASCHFSLRRTFVGSR